jgi:hypothetical protein
LGAGYGGVRAHRGPVEESALSLQNFGALSHDISMNELLPAENGWHSIRKVFDSHMLF